MRIASYNVQNLFTEADAHRYPRTMAKPAQALKALAGSLNAMAADVVLLQEADVLVVRQIVVVEREVVDVRQVHDVRREDVQRGLKLIFLVNFRIYELIPQFTWEWRMAAE